MSVINELDLIGDFYGVTINKGDIIVNDGIKNNALPVATDGYVLTADSTEFLGMKWSPSSGGSGGMPVNQINIVPKKFYTNSTNPVVIAGTSMTGLSGTILYTCILNCCISHARRFIKVGIYKNGTLITGSLRQIGGVDHVVFPVPVQITLNMTGSDIFDIRININNNDSYAIVQGITASSASQINSSTIFSTNDTQPVTIPGFVVSGLSGTILFIGSINCQLNHARCNFTIGFYKNNSLISNTQYKYGGIDDLITSIPIQVYIDMGTADIFSVKVAVDSPNVMLNVLDRTLINLIYNNTINFTPIINIISSQISTNDTLPYTISDMTLTGLVSENYLIYGNLNCYISQAHHFYTVGLYKNGILLLSKTYGGIDKVTTMLQFQILVTIIPTDVFTICINSDSSGNTVYINERSIGYTTY